MIRNGARTFICTDIERDGALQGANVEFFELLQKAFPEVRIIASGGVTTIDDLRALERVGMEAVIVGKALYEGKLRLEDLLQISKS
jgi:phosphoribosylformimino-5-aminoimidazole carboxamide ribotide isomerase